MVFLLFIFIMNFIRTELKTWELGPHMNPVIFVRVFAELIFNLLFERSRRSNKVNQMSNR